MEDRLPRKLAAILYADVAGYSRLTGEDEDATHRALSEFLDLISATVQSHRGQVMHFAGDAVLAKFDAVVDAMSAALATQNGLKTRNEDVPDERKVQFRIGVNLGDVIEDRGDIYGDGVNVAARLESLADPGGICISDAVRSAIGKKLDLDYEHLGEQEVKNIAEPVRAYRVLWKSEKAKTGGAVGERSEPALPEKPSISVLSFENMSTDPEQEFFADGISEDIITALSKVSRLRVVARNSSFAYKGKFLDIRKVADDLDVRYVLEGSVRSGGSRIRVTAQLIDASDGTHLWADRYDRKVDDVFDIQDEIVKEIVTHLRVRLTDGESALMFSRGTNSVDAWQYCVQASDLWLRLNASDHLVARKLAKQAIEIDPNYAAAWAILGWTYWQEGRLGVGGDSEKKLEETRDIAERAMALDENNPWAIGLNAHLASASGQHDKGIDIARSGLDRLPGNADVRSYLSAALMHAGRYEEALENFRAAIALNPLAPNWYLSGYSRALLCLGRFAESLKVIDRILADEPDFYQAWLYRAFIYQQTRQAQKAHESMAEAMRLAPNFRLRHIPRFFIHKDPVFLKKLTETFHKIGLPE